MASIARNSITTIVILVVFSNVANEAKSQVRRYQPTRTTVSPYLNIQLDNGRRNRLPNYFSLVRPLQLQSANDKASLQAMQQQSRQITDLSSTVESVQLNQMRGQAHFVAPTGKNGWFMISSRNARHQDTRDYFPKPNVRPRR